MAQEKISEIKNRFINIDISNTDEINALIKEYSEDDRTGVIKLVNSYKKKLKAYEDEKARIYAMEAYERKYSDYDYICGIDEVGRGPLAGPVCAGAVILPKNHGILYLNDSKQLSQKKREELYDEILKKAVAVKTVFVNHEVIDEINILNATKKAMVQAVNEIKVKPDVLLIDALELEGDGLPKVQEGIVKGDAKSVSIAAASIVAKVERDRLMEEMDKLYPEYGFASNKGYGSGEHIEAIKKYGPCPIHRMTFIKNFI